MLISGCVVTDSTLDPTIERTFYILPIWDDLSSPLLSEAAIAAEMDSLVRQLGNGNDYHKVGFSFVVYDEATLDRNCRIAKDKGIKLGLMVGTPTHTRMDLWPTFNLDLRCYQWRKNGSWSGYCAGGPDSCPHDGYHVDTRNAKIPTPSRLSSYVRQVLDAETRNKARWVADAMETYPDVIVCVNGPIEEELACAAILDDGGDYLSDYSPYAVTEFRDWLRHIGIYDGSTGAYNETGAPEGIIGPLVEIQGISRSQFYDDPDPSASNGTGVSFNDFFATDFTCWSLKYWDLALYPDAVVDTGFDTMPASGLGSCPGGFDAPRVLGESNYWHAWSWDFFDRNGEYPTGNPGNPAFGFRQFLVKHWVEDQLKLFSEAGIPKELLFPHQIPSELYFGYGGLNRNRSSASPSWTATLETTGNTGFTAMGVKLPMPFVNQYMDLHPGSYGWGLFEWHPCPLGVGQSDFAQNPLLYLICLSALQYYYDIGCHYLFPGWWQTGGKTHAIYPLNDSQFALAIKDFLAARSNTPYPGYKNP